MPGFSFGFGRRASDSAIAALSDDPFVPSADMRQWIDQTLATLGPHLDARFASASGSSTGSASFVGDPLPLLEAKPGNLDQLFDIICGVQNLVGQSDVEITLLESGQNDPEIPNSFSALASPRGQLVHALRGPGEYLLVYAPTVLRKIEVLMAGLARQLGLIALDLSGALGEDTSNNESHAAGVPAQRDAQLPALPDVSSLPGGPEQARLARAELAAIHIGLGTWVASGSYVFENACCGGGCGIPLGQLVAGLSMPEACYALAIDTLRRGGKQRRVTRALGANQKSAFSKSIKFRQAVQKREQAALASAGSPALSEG